MKKFISGFIVGALIFSMLGVFAAVTYVAKPVDFKVMVNGKEFVSDPPALEVDGRTYLPLRAMGEALNVPVNWNEELRQAEVGHTGSTAETNEYSRNNPAPLNTIQAYTKTSDWSEEDNYTVTVRILETIRGEKNIDKVRKSVVTDDKPMEGYEFMMVKIALSAVSIKGDNAIEASRYNFTGFSSNNEEIDQAYLHMDEKEGFSWLDGKLYEGGTQEGWLVLQVKKDDANPKIAYGLDYNGANGIWFSLQ